MSLLPWKAGTIPLMLAPMQGVTNRALRGYFVEHVRPDVIFTEFMRVNKAPAKKALTAADLRDIASEQGGVPLVVQLVGHGIDSLSAAARVAQDAGAAHINLNMGCPYGRTGSGLTGGAMLRCPDDLTELIPALREVVTGSFSIKIRAGYDDPEQILSLLPLFESSGVDFLILHPRTVTQKYKGVADHGITARVVRGTKLPVIANGDIRRASDGNVVLEKTGATGLMLGRGAIADPKLFMRLRGIADPDPGREQLGMELERYLREMLVRYGRLFCGDMQVLSKLKEIITYVDDPEMAKPVKDLLRARTLVAFEAALKGLC